MRKTTKFNEIAPKSKGLVDSEGLQMMLSCVMGSAVRIAKDANACVRIGRRVFYNVEKLSNEDAGKLFKAILGYEANGVIAELDGAAGMAFSFIQAQLNRGKANYEEVCRTRQENGKKGGRPKKEIDAKEPRKPNGYFENQMVNYKPDNDSDTDNDTENDIEQKIYTAQCAKDILNQVCYLLNLGNAEKSHKGRIKAAGIGNGGKRK